MPVPDFQSLMLPVLRATAAGQISATDLRDRVASGIGLTESELAERLPKGGQTVFANRVAWANTYLQRAGLIEKIGHGLYKITDEGRQAFAGNPERIDLRFLNRYPSYSEWRRGRSETTIASSQEIGPSLDTTQTPEEQMEASYVSLSAALEAELLERVREMAPASFERLIVDLLIAMGYGGGRSEMGQAIGRAGDGGIDGMIKEDTLGLDIVYMQAKRYADGNTVGRAEVQSFAGSLDGVGATKGIFFTTSTFSQGARDYVGRISKRIVLIDGAELSALMVRNGVGVRTRTVYEIKRVDEDYFSE
jgi:restriction system protein